MRKLEIRLLTPRSLTPSIAHEKVDFSTIELQQSTGNPAYVVLLRLDPQIDPAMLPSIMQLANDWQTQLKQLLKSNDLLVGIAAPNTVLEVYEVPAITLESP